tara:strand:+ start:866 stop:1396 length:531 start_codon:yes stop_codon:yes gene_type:complete
LTSDTLPPVNQEDIEWAYYLWNSLANPDGRWVLPGVGAYVRSGVKELTLKEIHFSKPTENAFSQSVFDQHHWIMVLADNIGWKVVESVTLATDNEGEINIPNDLVGHVSVCANRCGAVFRVEELNTMQQYIKIQEDLTCPCCGEKHSVDPSLAGVHIVLDDKSYRMNQDKIIKEEE